MVEVDPNAPNNDDGDEEEQQPERRVSMKRADLKKMEDKGRRVDEAETLAATLKRENAVLKAKLDLNEDQQTALFAVHKGDDLSPAALNATAVKLGFVKADTPDTGTDAARNASDSIDQAVNGSTSSSGSGLITPQVVRDWPADKLMRFRREHPDKFEQLKRNQPVPAVPGW